MGAGGGAREEGGGGVENLAAAADGFAEEIARRGGVDEADAVAVDGAEQHDEAGEFEQRLALRLRARAKAQGRGILENHQQRDLALLDEFLAVGFAEARGDVPVNVAHVVAELVFLRLDSELHAASRGKVERYSPLRTFSTAWRTRHSQLAQQGRGDFRELSFRLGMIESFLGVLPPRITRMAARIAEDISCGHSGDKRERPGHCAGTGVEVTTWAMILARGNFLRLGLVGHADAVARITSGASSSMSAGET